MRTRLLSALLAVLMAITSLLLGAAPSAAASGKEKTWRIATYVLGAGTILALAKGKGTLALIGGGATLLSYNQWRKEMKRRHRRADLAAYRAYRTRWLQQHRGRKVYYRYRR